MTSPQLQQRKEELAEAARKLPSTPKLTRKSIKLAEIAQQREQYRIQLSDIAAAAAAAAASGDAGGRSYAYDALLAAEDEYSASASAAAARSSGGRDDDASAAMAITTDEEVSAAEQQQQRQQQQRASSPGSRSVYDRLAERSRQYAQKSRAWAPPELEPEMVRLPRLLNQQ